MENELLNLGEAMQAEYLTKQLIQMPSYNGTDGEKEKGKYLYKLIQSFPYFQENKDAVWIQPLKEDGRLNVWALLEGKGSSKNTIIYHAHMDTVGIEDYGGIKDNAHDPERLASFFKICDSELEARADAKSGEWMFGRGALDMQSGISVHLVNLLYYTNHLEELEGNLLVLFNVDEENQHTGIRGALEELVRLQKEKGLNYVSAINNDFISPLYNGDNTKYIYCGGAGKLLPCFSIFGREAHVGESLLGVDPTLVASEINRLINQNFALTEDIDGELVLPPSCLYMKENKQSYDVQTPVSTRLYFNYFIYKKTPSEVISSLKGLTEQATFTIEKLLKDNFLAYCRKNKVPKRDINWNIEVVTLKEYMEYLSKEGLEPELVMNELLNKLPKNMDDRLRAFEMVEALQRLDPQKKPRVILFLAAPFLPSNTLQEDSQSLQIKQAVSDALLEAEKNMNEKFCLRKYFPYLCDGSFLGFHGDKAEIEAVRTNFPGMDTFFPLDLETMNALNIPAFNIGVYGKGGHKWTERVYKPYTFHKLPLLIRSITGKILNSLA